MKVAFIDRDGTLIKGPKLIQKDPPLYEEILCPSQVQILPGAVEGLQLLQQAGFALVMVTNQSGLGSRYFPRRCFNKVQQYLLDAFADNDITFRAIFVCPHAEVDCCDCRKPRTGLVDEFLLKENVDVPESIVIGDRYSDKVFAGVLGMQFFQADADTAFPLDSLRTTFPLAV